MKLSYALPLLSLQFLSPSSTNSGVVLASGFSQIKHVTFTQNAIVSRGGSQLSGTALESDVGPSLGVVSAENWDLLSDRGKAALSRLILYDVANGHAQKHVYGDWPEKGTEDEEKRGIAEQVRSMFGCDRNDFFPIRLLFENLVLTYKSYGTMFCAHTCDIC
jgi:hypothetical protein